MTAQHAVAVDNVEGRYRIHLPYTHRSMKYGVAAARSVVASLVLLAFTWLGAHLGTSLAHPPRAAAAARSARRTRHTVRIAPRHRNGTASGQGEKRTRSSRQHSRSEPSQNEPRSIVGDEALVAPLQDLNLAFGSFPPAQPRYFSLVSLGRSQLLLFARAGRYAEEYRSIVAALTRNMHGPRSLDPTEPAEYTIANGPKGTLAGRVNGIIRSHTVSHNAAFASIDEVVLVAKPRRGRAPVHVRTPVQTLRAMGGQHLTRPWANNSTLELSAGWHPSHREGIHALTASSAGLSEMVSGAWFPFRNAEKITRRPILTGYHPGCVERRDGLKGVCEYDGVSSTPIAALP